MSISVRCPVCSKKLHPNPAIVGRRVSCPRCHEVITVPEPGESDNDAVPCANLHEAVAEKDTGEIWRFIQEQQLSLIQMQGQPSGVPVVAEVGGVPGMLAFTTRENATNFADSTPQLADDDGSVSVFVVLGKDLLSSMSSGCGILLDPGEPGSQLMMPEVVAELQKRNSGGIAY